MYIICFLENKTDRKATKKNRNNKKDQSISSDGDSDESDSDDSESEDDDDEDDEEDDDDGRTPAEKARIKALERITVCVLEIFP